jgi:predicted 2-oxoglutarate/Fe(II)-dependent dioxygenase YbiX
MREKRVMLRTWSAVLSVSFVLAAAAAVPCRDDSRDCITWARDGECDKNPGYMHTACRKSCNTCEFNRGSVDAGGGQQHVQHSQDGAVSEFAVPAGHISETMRRAIDAFSDCNPQLLSNTSVPVLQLDNFATDAEVAELRRLGEDVGFESSEIEAGTSARQIWRNSWSAMCPLPTRTATRSEVLTRFFEKASSLTHVALENFEPTQIVRYEPGQFYKFHLDHFDELSVQPGGPRVYTLLVYLNTLQEGDGGETVFKYASGEEGKMLIVRPQKGRAILWPNTKDSDPTVREYDAMHASGPLKRGVKYAVNQWIRQRPVALL